MIKSILASTVLLTSTIASANLFCPGAMNLGQQFLDEIKTRADLPQPANLSDYISCYRTRDDMYVQVVVPMNLQLQHDGTVFTAVKAYVLEPVTNAWNQVSDLFVWSEAYACQGAKSTAQPDRFETSLPLSWAEKGTNCLDDTDRAVEDYRATQCNGGGVKYQVYTSNDEHRLMTACLTGAPLSNDTVSYMKAYHFCDQQSGQFRKGHYHRWTLEGVCGQ